MAAIEITNVRFEGRTRGPEVITAYKWVSRESGRVDWTDRPTMIKWIDEGNKAFVGRGYSQVNVAIVRPAGGEPYLRTFADDAWNNNLESLPPF